MAFWGILCRLLEIISLSLLGLCVFEHLCFVATRAQVCASMSPRSWAPQARGSWMLPVKGMWVQEKNVHHIFKPSNSPQSRRHDGNKPRHITSVKAMCLVFPLSIAKVSRELLGADLFHKRGVSTFWRGGVSCLGPITPPPPHNNRYHRRNHRRNHHNHS